MRLNYDPDSGSLRPTDTSPAWLRYVIKLVQTGRYQAKPSKSMPQRKNIRYLDRPAHLFKSHETRLRIVLQQGQEDADNTIDAYVSIPAPATEASPYLPRYPQHGDLRIHHTTWSMDEAGLYQLGQACLKWLDEPTCYADPDFRRVPLSMDVTKGFAFGKITKATFHTHHPRTQTDEGMWELSVVEGFVDNILTAFPEGEVKTYWVKASAITFYNAITVGYILIYKSENEADVTSIGGVYAFCKIVS